VSIPAVPKDERNAYFSQTHNVDPDVQLANYATPAEKKTCYSLQNGPLDKLLLQIHERAYADVSSAYCGSDDVLVQEIIS